MNIKLHYLYRDGGNYKNNHFEIFSNKNRLSVQNIEAGIKPCLIDETWFYVDKWELKDLHSFPWDNEIDHTFHEFDSIEETEEDATKEDIAGFLTQIKLRY